MKKIVFVFTATTALLLLTSAGQLDSVELDVPAYIQGKDSSWADDLLGSNSEVTIRTHGCALTSISMVYSYHTGKKLTPPKMNDWLNKNGGFQDAWQNGKYLGRIMMNWPVLTEYGEGWVYTRFDWKARPADLLLIKYYLDMGVPVITEVTYKSAPHYVVLTGYDETGFRMNDPEFPEEHSFIAKYNISDSWGSGPARNINGIRVLYPENLIENRITMFNND
ncbi:MAG: C39 family peptidase [Spirochaetales bacterium]|uniref:C39 family peptidase n=1 Tax=Candidatus Thalassospirochaeta sargassi TaxID=3119039 RepID=A0AAJ1IDF8_9SPIO|nr:C39 family peptidase [Spirochaetales bacterium]